MLYDIWLSSINILHKIWIFPIAENKTIKDMGNFSLPYDHKINIVLFFLFLLVSHLQKYFSITSLLSQLFIMYVLGIQYKEKWNKMAFIAVARCKFILAKK